MRTKEMRDPTLLSVIEEYKPKLLAWYRKKTADDTEDAGAPSDKLGFEERLRVHGAACARCPARKFSWKACA